jgi:hypothetical protein
VRERAADASAAERSIVTTQSSLLDVRTLTIGRLRCSLLTARPTTVHCSVSALLIVHRSLAQQRKAAAAAREAKAAEEELEEELEEEEGADEEGDHDEEDEEGAAHSEGDAWGEEHHFSATRLQAAHRGQMARKRARALAYS